MNPPSTPEQDLLPPVDDAPTPPPEDNDDDATTLEDLEAQLYELWLDSDGCEYCSGCSYCDDSAQGETGTDT